MNITIVFVRRPWWHPASTLIRWALPVSRFKWARASHSMVVDGDHVIHATFFRGVVRDPIDDAMRCQVLVDVRSYTVPNAKAGLAWARSQVGKDYDHSGAFGLSIAPDRNWQEDDAWFCHELCAGAIHHAGRRLFRQTGHVSDTALLLVNNE